ncbi:MAG: hypothetical protein LBQ47_06460 [Endomicrobium sp.]|jgi:hypothetical protein|nr:hypothetical protein [Endomicrobium sp.]
MKVRHIKILSLTALFLIAGFICIRDAHAAKTKSVDLTLTAQERAHLAFYIYADFKSPLNHYYPSGWMGDSRDLSLNQNYAKISHSGKNGIKIQYTPKGTNRWAGVYWQYPANNWGDKSLGYDLSKATYLTFWAKGETGSEIISEVKVGGLKGAYPDSCEVLKRNIRLTKEWKLYYIDLRKADTSNIAGGFAFVLKRKENPKGAVFYLDEIRYEMNK